MSNYKTFQNLSEKDENNAEISLDTDEKSRLKASKESIKKVPFHKIFRFSTKFDILMILIGTVGAILNGATIPARMYFFTSIIDKFAYKNPCNSSINITSNYTTNIPPNANVFMDEIIKQVVTLMIVAIISMVFTYIQNAFFMIFAEKQAKKIRILLFSSILKQDVGWYDVYKSGELTSRLTDDINKIKDGFSDKFGRALQSVSTILTGFLLAFYEGWLLCLVILSLSPLVVVSIGILGRIGQNFTKSELKSYAKAGAIAEEVLTAVRTVFSFNGSEKEHTRYEKNLEEARKNGIKRAVSVGLSIAFLFLIIYCAYALGFWYGWKLTQDKDSEYTVGKILLVFFTVLIGMGSLGGLGPYFEQLAVAKAAAYEVFKIIDRVPSIDSSSKKGKKPNNFVGDIEFKNVSFNYPSRPDSKILNGISFKIKSGSTNALVGSSGCGKSTCIQLIQRFYDPIIGSVMIDNNDIKSLNIKWMRENIGVVNQEPVLFDTTIYENIKFGRESATDEEIIKAAKNANAHDFIMSLPQAYQTMVGNLGGKLSGGQKQRIAIARALVRNPKILLLDEATSALDNESESIVQEALDKARQGRTVIIIAHRLSTIINADTIFAMDKGEVIEIGSHSELIEKKGLYFNLVTTQQAGSTDFEKKNEKKLKRLQSSAVENENICLKAKEVEYLSDQSKSKKKGPSMIRALKLNSPEWHYILFGCIFSLLNGGLQPASSIVLSKITTVFGECDLKKQEDDVNLFCIFFVSFGLSNFLTTLLKIVMFGFSGENLTKRLRSKAFKSMLTQDLEWFDNPENNVGKLCTKLSVEAAAVQGATGIQIGTALTNIASLGIGLGLAFYYGWAITLVILGFVPFIIIGGKLQSSLLNGFAVKDKSALEDAGKITIEAISNIRTVAISNKENYFIDLYDKKLSIPYKASLKSSHSSSFILGFTQSLLYIAMAAAFWLGGHLVEKGDNKFEDVMIAINCVIFGASSVGQTAGYMPDLAKAKAAVASIFELFDRIPEINNFDKESGIKLDDDYQPDIKFNSIEFNYPSRPESKILNGIDIQIKHGQRIGLVGSSGCGKSTITQLLERFYNCKNGSITIDNVNIRELNLYWLRSQIGLVSQEPILFDLSIAENIAYGDNSRDVHMDEIIEAAKKANIHDFIITLPDAYKTNVGSKGTQLSGGQKQRIAIARALIRNPKILLLDEATSALDSESEKIVQDALDKAQHGRTCIIIAHRLSTIRYCDIIIVLKNGLVTEKGTHEELINLNGFYAKLNGKQQ